MYNETAYALGANRSCIRDLFEYGRQRAAIVGEENIFDFSLGNPSIPSPDAVNQTICQILADTPSLQVHGYTSAVGDTATRQAIADDLNHRYNAGVRADDLFITCGAAPALTAVFRALAVPGAEILAVAPYFPEYKPFAENAGAAFKVVPPDVPDFQIRLDAVEAAITPNTAAIILNTPNNPSGTVYTRQTLEQLAALLTRKGAEYGHPIYLVSDEPYRELAYGAEVPFLPTIYPNTIVCYSYSKSLSLPGERIGYVYVPRQAADSTALYAAVAGAARAMGHVCAPALWQKVIARCAHLRPDLDAYDRNRPRRRCGGFLGKGQTERSAGRPRRRLRLPRLFPAVLLRQLRHDPAELEDLRGIDLISSPLGKACHRIKSGRDFRLFRFIFI